MGNNKRIDEVRENAIKRRKMNRIECLKDMLDKDYKETSIWEVEVDYTKTESHDVDGTVTIVDITDFIPERIKMFDQRNYRWFFEQLKKDLKTEPTINDYYRIYTKLLKELTSYLTEVIYFHVIYEKSKNKKIRIEDVLYAHEKEELKLDFVFNEYAETVEKTDVSTIGNYADKEDDVKKKPEYITWLFEKGHIDENNCVQIALENIVKKLYLEYMPLKNVSLQSVTPGLLTPLRRRDGLPFSNSTKLIAIKNGKPEHLKKKSNKRHG